MSVELSCPACKAVNAFLDAQAGSMGKCGQCNAPLYIPRPDEMPSPVTLHRVRGKAGKRRLLWLAAAVAGLGLAGCLAATGVGAYYFLFYCQDSTPTATAPTPAPKTTGKDTDTKEISTSTLDAFDLATTVQAESSKCVHHEGWLKQARDEVVVKFRAPSGGIMVVYFDPVGDTKLEGRLLAYDGQRKPIAQNDAAPDQRVSQVQFPVTGDQDYFVKVAGFDGGTGKFKVTLAHLKRFGSTFESALELRLTRTGSAQQSGKLETVDDQHTFGFVAPITGQMIAEIGPGADSTLQGWAVALDESHTKLTAPDARVSFPVIQGKTYYVQATVAAGRSSNRTGTYILSLRTEKSVSLQWKFKEGEKFYLEEKNTSENALAVPAGKSLVKLVEHRLSSLVVKAVTAEGFVLEQRIEVWKNVQTGDVAGGKNDRGVLLEQATKDVVFVFTMTRSGLITKYEGDDKVIKRVAEILVSVARTPPDFAPNFYFLPLLPVHKGEKWRIGGGPLTGMAGVTRADDFTYEGKGKEGELIAGKGTFGFLPMPGGIMLAGGVKLLRIDYKKNEQTNKIVFDADKGRLVSQEIYSPLVFTATVEEVGVQREWHMEDTRTTTVRLHATRPTLELAS
jgi:hypothetical protein